MTVDAKKCITGNNYKEGGSVALAGIASYASPDRQINTDLTDEINALSKEGNIVFYHNNFTIEQTENDNDYPPADTDAIVTYDADENKRHSIAGIAWSYDVLPTSGNLQIENGSGVIILNKDITSDGPGLLNFESREIGDLNTLFRVTLSSGGMLVMGKLEVLGHRLE